MRVWLKQRLHHSGEKHFNSHTREGVTFNPVVNMVCIGNFNSHTREGVTTARLKRNVPFGISTHTPVRVWLFWNSYGIFNAISTHTPVRVWPNLAISCIITSGFQLTHPWGCDHIGHIEYLKQANFNSHTREGVTKTLCEYSNNKNISTHTPVRVWPVKHISK